MVGLEFELYSLCSGYTKYKSIILFIIVKICKKGFFKKTK